jgi:hypothetical protein
MDNTSGSSHHGFEMTAKVTGLNVLEREKAWSIMHPAPPTAEPPPLSNQKQSESMYVLVKLKPLVKEDVDANGNDEERVLTIRRDDITELGLKVGDIINLRLSRD